MTRRNTSLRGLERAFARLAKRRAVTGTKAGPPRAAFCRCADEEGAVMTILLNARPLATLVASCIFASARLGGRARTISLSPRPRPTCVSAPVALDYALETEMTVHDWVLCTSAPLAEQLGARSHLGHRRSAFRLCEPRRRALLRPVSRTARDPARAPLLGSRQHRPRHAGLRRARQSLRRLGLGVRRSPAAFRKISRPTFSDWNLLSRDAFATPRCHVRNLAIQRSFKDVDFQRNRCRKACVERAAWGAKPSRGLSQDGEPRKEDRKCAS